MDWLTFLIRLIEALAWPLTVAALIIVLVRRPEFRGLVPLLRKFKTGPLEAEFEREIREISEEAGGVTTPESEARPEQRLIEMATMYPRTAILEAWVGVETAARKAAVQKAASSPAADVSTPLKAMRELVRVGALWPDDVALFHDLRGLRNQAAHVEDFEPSRDAALEYVKLASQLEARLRSLAEPS